MTAAVLVTRSWLAAAASAVFALSTLSAYLVAVWIGLFGFKEVRTRAGIAAGLIEVAAFAVLALAAITAGPCVGPTGRSAGRPDAGAGAGSRVAGDPRGRRRLGGRPGPARRRGGQRGRPARGRGRAGATLKTAKIGGVTVLTNPNGLTLYWFAPDTPATSRCTGSCTASGRRLPAIQAGPGITGRLGTIERPGGGLQATYDGHPLYTYIGDNGPGQAQR